MMALATGKGGNSVLYPVNGEKGKEGEKKRDSKRQKRNLRRETTEKEREKERRTDNVETIHPPFDCNKAQPFSSSSSFSFSSLRSSISLHEDRSFPFIPFPFLNIISRVRNAAL